MGLFAKPPDQSSKNARLITLANGPLLVRWNGEPIWVPVHWIASGRKGRSMPCINLGAGCPLHTTPRKWHVCTPGLIRTERRDAAADRRREQEAERRRIARFRQLPEVERERLIGEAEERCPLLRGKKSLIEGVAISLLAEPEIESPAKVLIEQVIVDLPSGAAKFVDRQFKGTNWRGRKCLLRRVSNETAVEVVEEPIVNELPEPASVARTLCEMWGFNVETVTEEIDTEGRTVLRFPLP